jgi:NAD-dependent SIR2 family protein deacetylase
MTKGQMLRIVDEVVIPEVKAFMRVMIRSHEIRCHGEKSRLPCKSSMDYVKKSNRIDKKKETELKVCHNCSGKGYVKKVKQ